MNKTQLIAELAQRNSLSINTTRGVVDSFMEVVREELQKGESVSLLGFGSFLIKRRKERSGVNPSSGEKITIQAANLPAFKASKSLRDAL